MITVIILSLINGFYSENIFSFKKASLKAGFSVNLENHIPVEPIHGKIENDTKENWYLEIPAIYLKATIAEGTTKEIMDQFIGHFEESKRWEGNVCLAAHNRGYENNYFSGIKSLKEGDKITYYYNGSSREYEVENNSIIQATDLSCIENTEENTITLITCVENEPNYRRCVKAIETKK